MSIQIGENFFAFHERIPERTATVSTCISTRRGALASFDHAYAVAVQLRETTGAEQLVIRTSNSVQAFRV